MSGSAAPKEREVGECAPTFSDDELPGFEKATWALPPEDDGQLVATLVRTKGPVEDERPAVLYVHGFVDYFFQTHVAQAFEEAGYRFHALDLRRYGRSLRKDNRPCYANSLSDYFAELDWAVDTITAGHGRLAGLVAHSTGGLISSLYLDAQKGKHPIERLALVSPFLKFNLGTSDKALAWLVARGARFTPHVVLPQKMNSVYGKTLHVSEGGEWDYDLSKKPLGGFPLYAGWFRMILAGHARIEAGLDIDIPILSMFSDQSRIARRVPVDADRSADLVLNVKHIRELSPKLGRNVALFEVPGGLHDLTLSRKPSRDLAISKMVDFISSAQSEIPG